MPIESGWELGKRAHFGEIPERHLVDLHNYQTTLILPYEHNGIPLTFHEDWWRIPGSYPQYGQVFPLPDFSGEQTIIVYADIIFPNTGLKLHSIGSLVTDDQTAIVHVVKKHWPDLGVGEPFRGHTGAETRIIRPLDELVAKREAFERAA